MALITLLRRGSLLLSKTAKLIVAVPAPTIKANFDQCNILKGYTVGASYSIAGRVDCFQPVTEVARVSVRYTYGLGFAAGPGNLSDDLFPAGLFVPNPPGFLRTRTRFLNQPSLPIESTVDGANYPLTDICNVAIGTVEDKVVQRYSYTADCTAISKYGFSSTVARHSSITNVFIGEHISNLMESFYLNEQSAASLALIEAEMLSGWESLAGVAINLNVGAFEP